MALRLISEYQATTRPAFVTLGKKNKIGRNASNDVILCSTRQVAGIRGTVTPSSWISRSHAIIYEELEGYYLEDCSSTGTYMNNVRLPKGKRILLKDGVEIFFGVDSFKHRRPPKVGEKSEESSDFFFVFEKTAKARKRKNVLRTPLQMPKKRKIGQSQLQYLNSRKAGDAETKMINRKPVANDWDSSDCATQLHSVIEDETAMKMLPPAQLMETPVRSRELPYQQTITTLRDMLKTERDEKAATVEQIRANAQQREAELNNRLEQVQHDRKLRESELNELRLSIAQKKAEASAEVARFKGKLEKLQSEMFEKEKRNTEYMASIVTKLTADHKKEIAEHAQRIRELEMCRTVQARTERVVLQFGERANSRTRRCQISLEWTVERLCDLVHRKYIKKLPGNQMEVVLQRTFSVMEHTRRLDSFGIRKGERLVIRKSYAFTQTSISSIGTEALCENLPYVPPMKRRPSLLTITPNLSPICQVLDKSVTSVVGERNRSCFPKKSLSLVRAPPESYHLSPLIDESKIRSYRDKVKKPASSKRSISMDDEKDSSKESSADIAALHKELDSKPSSVLQEMEMEHEEYYPREVQHRKPLPKQKKKESKPKKKKRTKSLINPKLKPNI